MPKKTEKKKDRFNVYKPKGFPKFTGAGPRRDKKLREAECEALSIPKDKCK